GVAGPANTFNGVLIGNGVEGNTVGGTVSGAGNVISGNSGYGVSVGFSARLNLIAGNFIGTNSDGTGAVGNVSGGIPMHGIDHVIGGTTPLARNVISGNQNAGVEIGSGTGNLVQGNYIGTNVAGTAALANANGVLIASDASNNTLGGTTAGAGNLI